MNQRSLTTTLKLSSGQHFPQFGLGCYKLESSEVIEKAIHMGYKMLDCASFYANEEIVGEALKKSGVKRDDISIVSKVWWDEVEDVEAACKRSLQKLGVNYLDLYLVHWPIAIREVTDQNGEASFQRIKIPMYKIWEQMEGLVDKGLVKSIGVSNFNTQLLWDMLNYARIHPVCNEIELHPLNS